MKRALAILGMMLMATAAQAQSLWLPRDHANAVMLEVFKPDLKFVDADFLSPVLFLGVRASIGSNASIVAEVPYARVNGDYFLFIGSSEVAQSTVGNPYVGVELHDEGSSIFGEFGVRIPATSEDELAAAIAGTYADVGRFNTFYPRLFSMQAAFNVRAVPRGGIVSRLRLGTALAVSTEGGGPELFAIYALQTGYEGRSVRAGLAASGQGDLTDDFGSLGSRILNQLELHADVGGRVRPGLNIKLPLSPATTYVSVVLGLSVSVALGSEPPSD